MEAVIVFFRDILSGTLYVVVSIVCSVLILLCLFLLVKRSKKLKGKVEEYEQSHIVIINAKGEEETIEIGKTSTSFNPSNNDVVNMSATASINNVPKSAVSTNSAVNSTIPPSKSVVTINPLEVASVSSTMNLIGSSNSQKNTIPTVSTDISGKVEESVQSGTVIDSDNIASAVGTTKVIDPDSIASAVGTTKVIDPDSIASTVGTTKVIDPDSIASTVGTTKLIDPDSTASTDGTTQLVNGENIENEDVVTTQ